LRADFTLPTSGNEAAGIVASGFGGSGRLSPAYRARRARDGKSWKARNERHALSVLEDFVAAGAKGAEIGSGLDAIVEVRDRVPDVGFKQITVRRVTIVQIECGDHDHDDVPEFFIAALVRIEFSATRVT
jgi:hypothetical protein